VFAGLEADQTFGCFFVEPSEEGVDPAFGLVAADRVGYAEFAWSGTPFDEAGFDLVSGPLVVPFDLREKARLGHRLEERLDDHVRIAGLS
jgi:hypothetical protein